MHVVTSKNVLKSSRKKRCVICIGVSLESRTYVCMKASKTVTEKHKFSIVFPLSHFPLT